MCLVARKKCFARGDIPCDVLFVGEAPGDTEDREGIPFCGVSGILLQEKVVKVAVPKGVRCGFVNLVACMPKDDRGKKTGAPTNDEVMNCKDRFHEIFRIMSPRLVIAVGDEARDWLDPKCYHNLGISGVPVVDITHPGHVVRAQVYLQADMVRKMAATVAAACERYLK